MKSVIFLFIYLFSYSLHNLPEKQDIKNNTEIRYTYQFVNYKTGIYKLLENTDINHTTLVIF